MENFELKMRELAMEMIRAENIAIGKLVGDEKVKLAEKMNETTKKTLKIEESFKTFDSQYKWTIDQIMKKASHGYYCITLMYMCDTNIKDKIKAKLEEEGFEVENSRKNRLFISWRLK